MRLVWGQTPTLLGSDPGFIGVRPRSALRRTYSTLICELLITFPHFAISPRIVCASSAGLLGLGDEPSFARCETTAGVARMFAISVLSFCTIACGVRAGATSPYQLSTENPRTPCSATL